ncbi:endoribonuclease Dicer-like protein 3-like [Gossypium australe]|uniref:Endoribonuclease Dicer-like protein 3-like n=1 Tax=Gossypium australe TaxID=47621 RepID=A0A5B6WXT5_9ROSI|nr:endoribonuclease Dicer-like protein 3-like [Gossypium australe]
MVCSGFTLFVSCCFCLENIPDTKEECEAYKGVLQCKRFLNEVLQIIRESLPLEKLTHLIYSGDEKFLNSRFDYLKAVDSGYISPKLHELIELFLSLGIVTAKVIERFVKKESCLSCFVVSCLTGSNTSVDSMAPKIQKETLESCQSGKGNEKQRDQLYDIIRSEHSMTNTAMNRDPDLSLPENRTLEETNVSIVAATGASVEETSKNRTTRRKELHGTTQIRALSGCWGEKAYALVFFAYKIDFSCNVVSVVYSEFVLLIESKLADDVGNIEVDLYLI